MDLIELLISYGPWSWIVGGIVLLAIELVAPGGILVWLGAAAIAVGLITLVQPLGWPVQWMLYGVLSIAGIAAWLNFVRRTKNSGTDQPRLNARADQYIGKRTVLTEAIVDGVGRVALGDSFWRVSGPDLPAGEHVKIIGSDGPLLTVEASSDA